MACSAAGRIQVELGLDQQPSADGWAELRLEDGSRLIRWFPRNFKPGSSSGLRKQTLFSSVIHEVTPNGYYISLADSVDWECTSLKTATLVVHQLTLEPTGTTRSALVQLEERELESGQSYRLQITQKGEQFSAVWIKKEVESSVPRTRLKLPPFSVTTASLGRSGNLEVLQQELTNTRSQLENIGGVVTYSLMRLRGPCAQSTRLEEYVGHIQEARQLGERIHQLVQMIGGDAPELATEVSALFERCGFQLPTIEKEG